MRWRTCENDEGRERIEKVGDARDEEAHGNVKREHGHFWTSSSVHAMPCVSILLPLWVDYIRL